MAKKLHETGYSMYWWAWFALLVLTIGMVLISDTTIPRLLLASLLIFGMLAKVSLIGGYFMHLRFERIGLVLCVVLGILATAAALFLLLVPDGLRILELSER